MAIACTARQIIGSTTDGTSFTSGTSTNTNNATFVIFVSCTKATGPITAPTISGTSITGSVFLVDSVQYNTIASPTYALFCFFTKTTNTAASTYTVDFGAQTITSIVVHSEEITGDNQSFGSQLSFVQSSHNSADSGTALSCPVLTFLSTNDAGLAAYGSAVNTAITNDAAWTEKNDAGQGTPAIRQETQFLLNGTTSTGTSLSSAAWAGINVEIADTATVAPSAVTWVRRTQNPVSAYSVIPWMVSTLQRRLMSVDLMVADQDVTIRPRWEMANPWSLRTRAAIPQIGATLQWERTRQTSNDLGLADADMTVTKMPWQYANPTQLRRRDPTVSAIEAWELWALRRLTTNDLGSADQDVTILPRKEMSNPYHLRWRSSTDAIIRANDAQRLLWDASTPVDVILDADPTVTRALWIMANPAFLRAGYSTRPGQSWQAWARLRASLDVEVDDQDVTIRPLWAVSNPYQLRFRDPTLKVIEAVEIWKLRRASVDIMVPDQDINLRQPWTYANPYHLRRRDPTIATIEAFLGWLRNRLNTNDLGTTDADVTVVRPLRGYANPWQLRYRRYPKSPTLTLFPSTSAAVVIAVPEFDKLVFALADSGLTFFTLDNGGGTRMALVNLGDVNIIIEGHGTTSFTQDDTGHTEVDLDNTGSNWAPEE